MRGNPQDGPPTLPVGVEPCRTGSGLEYLEIQAGDGASAGQGMTVRIHYHGWLTNGTLIESTVDRGDPLEFVVGDGQVIVALEEGVEGMKVGGTRRLIVPSDLAYGPQGSGDRIPPYASLILDVGLLEVREQPRLNERSEARPNDRPAFGFCGQK